MRVRFAPSPTGLLHVGNARTALFNWLLARGGGGTFILRIEDTDAERSTPESERGILDDLRWLGLQWDEGPDVGGAYGPYRQSERLDLYRSYAGELLDAGQAYYCFCSPDALERERQAALEAGRPPQYSGACRALPPAEAARRVAAGEAAAVRFRVPARRDVAFEDVVRGTVRFDAGVIGDPVLLRSDGRPAYNFAVVVDDALMEVTHVVRGEDHVSNTPRQVLLYEALHFEAPVFAHLALVLGPDHTPLSKRHGATSVAEFRNRGILPEALLNYLALLGWSPGESEEILPAEELARRFSLEHVGRSSAVFDVEKLAWVNRHYLRDAAPARLAALAMPHLVEAGFVLAETATARDFAAAVMPLAAASVDRIEQIPARIRFLFEFDPGRARALEEVGRVLAEPGASAVIAALAADLAGAPRLVDRERFRAAAARIRQATGCKGRALFHPIRVALTGEAGGPELDLAVPAIERGAELPPGSGVAPVLGCRERAARFAGELQK
ncbi:MAG TPA: glutamate--tRNA ligase [Vicinamibacterales bacterium]|nr:glutamate--tRNA ligase [Vicinamibacterales bacterium]HPW21596.1 glutamate--tRNA ligase [Vicinamibacterales bacterium]